MQPRPLVITEDGELLDDLLRIAAAAAVDVVHARLPGSRSGWQAASMVVLDARLVRHAVAAGLPRRPGVIVVGTVELDPDVWQYCVLLGVDRTLMLPGGEDDLVAVLADGAPGSPGDGRVIAVIGARGGVGASVFAAAVAVAGVRSGDGAVLADCDPWGVGQDLLMGIEADPGVRWSDIAAPAGRVSVEALTEALPALVPGRAGPWRGLRSAGRLSVLAMNREAGSESGLTADTTSVVIDSCRRSGLLLVVDVPRAPSDVASVVLGVADAVVLVATADVSSCYAARRLLDRLTVQTSRLGLVVRGPSPGGLGADDLSTALDLPLIAQMRPQPGLARDLELGHPPGLNPRSPLGLAAARVLDATQSAVGV